MIQTVSVENTDSIRLNVTFTGWVMGNSYQFSPMQVGKPFLFFSKETCMSFSEMEKIKYTTGFPF